MQKKIERSTYSILMPIMPVEKVQNETATGNGFLTNLSAENKELPLSNNLTEEKQALLFHVDPNDFINLKDYEWNQFFPLYEGKRQLDQKYLIQFMNEGQDIRPFVLKAYLDDAISKHLLITLFMMQGALSEFFQNEYHVMAFEPVKILPLTQDGEITTYTKEKLLPYFIDMAPPCVQSRQAEFVESLNDNLKNIPEEENFFALIQLPIEEVFKAVHEILMYLSIMRKTLNERGFSKFLNFLSEHVNSQGKGPLDALIQQVMCDDSGLLPKEIEKLKQDTLAFTEYMAKKKSLFTLVMKEISLLGVVNIDYCIEDGELKCSLIVIGSRVQDAFLQAVTGKNPETLVKKVPMFGQVTPESLHRLVENGQRPVGLSYKGIAISKNGLVHDVPAGEYGYPFHDMEFHYTGFFLLRAFLEPIYQLILRFSKVITQITHVELTHAKVVMLDMASSFEILKNYKDDENIREKLKYWREIILKSNRSAMAEYDAILIADVLKNKNEYLDLLKPLLTEPYTEQDINNSFLIFLEELCENFYPFPSSTFVNYVVLPSEPYIKQYSHSLGAFMLTLSVYMNHFRKNKNELLKLCGRLDDLEKAGHIYFKWNVKGGMMLNIGEESFRFRSTETSATEDFRYSLTYEHSTPMIRKFSCDDNWWEDLETAVSKAESNIEYQRVCCK